MAKRTKLQAIMREARKARGLTLQQAGDLLGISKGHLHDIESGRHKNPTLSLLRNIARNYGICLCCGVGMPADDFVKMDREQK
jgi:transcriptional regulator with XRE-family HTH domain